MAGPAYRHQDRAADRHSDGVRGAAPSEVAGGDHRTRAERRESEGPDHHGAVPGRAGRSSSSVRHRELRFGVEAAVEGHPDTQGQGAGRVSESDRIHHPADGCDVCELLHEGSDGDPDQGVPVAGRRDEEDRAEGGEAVREHGGGGGELHQAGDPAGVFSELLGPEDGSGSQELPAAGGYDGGNRSEGRRGRYRGKSGGGSEG